MSDEIDMRYNLLLEEPKEGERDSRYEYQVFWNNFVKMMQKQNNNVTLVWNTQNKSFTRVLCSAISDLKEPESV